MFLSVFFFPLFGKLFFVCVYTWQGKKNLSVNEKEKNQGRRKESSAWQTRKATLSEGSISQHLDIVQFLNASQEPMQPLSVIITLALALF